VNVILLLMNRRQFVQVSAAAAVVRAEPFSNAETPSASSKIKIGFWGAAHSHALGKWKAIQDNPHFELVGIADDSVEVRQTFKDIKPRFYTRQELLDQTQALVVDSAVRDHARDAQTALQAGKHLHLEKPPSATFAEFEKLVALAREKALLLQVGYQWRYHAGFEKVFEAVRQGWLGRVFFVRAVMNIDLAKERRAEWAEFHGGGMFELGSHMIDPVIRLMGKPDRVTSRLRNDSGLADDLRDNNVVVFEFPQAMAVITNVTWQPNAMEHRTFEVCGTNGTMTLQPIEPPALRLDLAKAAGPYRQGKQEIPLPLPYERYVRDFQNLADAIQGKKPLAVSTEEDLLLHEWLLRACEMM
jgi:predicted dehydrogenase